MTTANALVPAVHDNIVQLGGNRPGVIVFGGENEAALVKSLDQLNYEVTHAAGPAAGARHPIAVIVSDDRDHSLELCTALAKTHPVILISDERPFAWRLAAAKAGISALIRRPVNLQELSDWLKYFSERSSPEPISVLIVDDDWLSCELHAEVLRSAGMVVTTVNDPTRAVEALEGAIPDLILMDLQMPKVDGITLAQIIRQSRQFIALPIIFLSAEQDEQRQMSARQLGGDDFIVKPIDPMRLVTLVRLRADRTRLLRSLIERDGLTGLYDHSRFLERLSLEVERCRRNGVEICLAMIDIDHFKRINDTYGHPVGDVVIRTLSSLITGGLRQIDIVGRCGGEEFGVILFDTDPVSAGTVIDRLRHRLARLPFEADGREFSVTFSAGIASSRSCSTLNDLMSDADQALYRAKRLGRNRIELAHNADPVVATGSAGDAQLAS